MKTHKVIYKQSETQSFLGSFFNGTKAECDNYCKNNNGRIGHYFTYITVPS